MDAPDRTRPPLGQRLRWRSPRSIELLGVVGFVLVSTLTLVMVVPNGATSASGIFWNDWVQTDYGPLGPADVNALVAVRQAGLWEIPVGQQAVDHAQSEVVRDVGATLAEDHLLMDEQVREIAAMLDVRLPSTPNREQQRWMDELSGLSGAEWDRAFANRLRYAHGNVLEVLAEVRAGTRNELVRTFVQHCVLMVMRHISLLESTGLVEYESLPEPRPPERRPRP
ncbi:DUF4142 domain-containing protein [Nocardiopsis exhalans]|uniref:DUF4142 domain-containing protein n=2 Tax=Nocardiopsis TaxID=2013 RepID=A0ABY5D592_9ACTN|nr:MULTISPECIES: DUF4142 domain-containing protein [Nocardiopsis]MBB5493072.1 putative outer membrane protein [Nocardiopsis metallicus]USY19484.1 DUF4142 domain-containing protein [Nocardiopsis exhalans]